MIPARPALVIFDCDGVLVDSEPISMSVLLAAIAEAGLALSEEIAFERFLGRSLSNVCEILQREFGVGLGAGALERMREKLFARFRRELKPVPGVTEMLRKLATARCVASSSQPERIRLCLDVTGLLDSFASRIYSATMVSRGKPAPDLFLLAARRMGVAPRDCLVVEDSPAGIAAAKAAGMRAFGFVGGSHAAKAGLAGALALAGPDAIFDDMARLPDLIGLLGAPH